MMSAKSFRFIMERVFGKDMGDVNGPFHTDGRCIVPEEKMVEQIGGSDYGILVDEVQIAIFKIIKHYRQLPSIIVQSGDLVVCPDVARIFGRFKLGEEIGSLPVTLVNDGSPIAHYNWFFATKVWRAPCSIPDSDLALLGNMKWMITDELHEELVKREFTGVCFQQIGQ